jgi:imidazole glycerol-phosphate synthase subunit HisH
MNRNTVYVFNYGAGSIASVVNMIRHVGGEAENIDDPDLLPRAGKLILPPPELYLWQN